MGWNRRFLFSCCLLTVSVGLAQKTFEHAAHIALEDLTEAKAAASTYPPWDPTSGVQTPPDYDASVARWSSLIMPENVVVMAAQPDWYRWWFTTLKGYIVTLPDAATQQSDFSEVLDISDRVVLSSGYTEYGLLNFVFSPNWTTDRQFYVYYVDERVGTQQNDTNLDAGRLDPTLSNLQSPACRHDPNEAWSYTAMVSRFTWTEGDPEATRQSEEVIMFWGMQDIRSHPGSGMVFVGDLLHVATGDQGDQWQAQSLDTPKGKLLRINPFEPANGLRYSVPADNPFVGLSPEGETWYEEIYAYGLRNPFRCAADDAGQIVCGIVGQDNVESVVMIPSGSNLGWPDFEGSSACYMGGIYGSSRPTKSCFPVTVNGSLCITQPTDYELTAPLLSYCHESTIPLTGYYTEGVCSDLFRGVAPMLIGFYKGAGDSSGLVEEGDLLFVDPGQIVNSPKLIRLRQPTANSTSDWDPVIVYGAEDPYSFYGPYIIAIGTDWDGEINVMQYSAETTNFVYRLDTFNYIDYPNTAVPAVGAPAPTPVDVPSTPAPFAQIAVAESEICGGDAYNYPEVNWTQHADGTYSGNLTFDVMKYTTSHGTTTTRGYFSEDGAAMLPGPIIRMKPGGVYNLTLVNALSADWPNAEGLFNRPRLPCVTNLHLHGLHVSPSSPSDDVSLMLYPGESYTHTYIIPVDHAGGTFFYHNHVHGSAAIQSGAGTLGMLIIEDNEYLEANDVWPDMPEVMLVMQYMTPNKTLILAEAAGDELYETSATADHYLVNGCDEESFTLDMSTGQWTKLRMLHVGTVAGSVVVTIESNSSANLTDSTQCDTMVLAKDGVYLQDSPRGLWEPKLLFSISSRVDVAVRCPVAGSYKLVIAPVAAATSPIFTGALTVTGTGALEPDLQPWTPIRPYYLQDLREETVDGEEPYILVVRSGTINDIQFSGFDMAPMLTINENTVNEWYVEFSNTHPLHVHINHLQLVGNVTNYAELPDWHQQGDWLDTIDSPVEQLVRWRADRYGGMMMVHCHIYEHSDTGMMGMVQINDGEGSDGGLTVLHWPQGLANSSCNRVMELGETDVDGDGIEDYCEPGAACANTQQGDQCQGEGYNGPKCCPGNFSCKYNDATWSGCFPQDYVLSTQTDANNPCNDVFCSNKGYCTTADRIVAVCNCEAGWISTGADCEINLNATAAPTAALVATTVPIASADTPVTQGIVGGSTTTAGKGRTLSTAAWVGVACGAAAVVALFGGAVLYHQDRRRKGASSIGPMRKV